MEIKIIGSTVEVEPGKEYLINYEESDSEGESKISFVRGTVFAGYLPKLGIYTRTREVHIIDPHRIIKIKEPEFEWGRDLFTFAGAINAYPYNCNCAIKKKDFALYAIYDETRHIFVWTDGKGLIQPVQFSRHLLTMDGFYLEGEL